MQTTPNKYNEKFREAIARLNPEQMAAVEQMDGPVLVIAGPGTGKTQILAARIGKILLETDASAHENSFALPIPMPARWPCASACSSLSGRMLTG